MIATNVPPIGKARERAQLQGAVSYSYRETGGAPLKAHFFFPADFRAGAGHPVVVFFHGGFWDTPMPTQFVPHCHHFADRGAIAVAAETRVAQTHGTGPVEAIDDARSLLLWIKVHAARLGVDSERVVAGGSAGGALLALAAAMPKDGDLPALDGVDCRPRAVVLFSPLTDTSPRGDHGGRFPDTRTAKKSSPVAMVRKGLPPMILFHGKSDRVIPFATAARFSKAMRRKRNTCEFVDFENAEHSFFNFNVNETNFECTVAAADRFLTGLGILSPPSETDAL